MLKQSQIDAAVSMGAVLSHPTRLRILDFVGHERKASPTMYSAASEVPLSNVDYDFVALAEADCPTLSEVRRDPGSRDHLYRLTPVGQRLLQLVADLT